MLKYLKIFSWLLLTFGVVGFLAIALGFAPDIGSRPAALGLMATQAAVGALIFYGFKLNRLGQLDTKSLLYGGWALIVLLVILGQVWVNISDINL